jgi:NAD(P)H-hydrate epimerase
MLAIKSDEMQMIDQYMIEKIGLSSLVLMENASKTVVDEIINRFPLNSCSGKSIVVLCGTGNNGGDGLCVSRWLRNKGYTVSTIIVGNVDKLSGDVKKQYELLLQLDKLRNEEMVFSYLDCDMENLLKQSDIIIDGLIGTGCHRTLSEELLKVVEIVNQCKSYILSIDIPTGINADNGKIMGDAVRANSTITFCLPKLGLLLNPGSECVGELVVTDIGIFEEALETLENPVQVLDFTTLLENKNLGRFKRKQYSHKGTFGTVGIIAGDKNMLGATVLAAKAAYRTGAGLVKIFIEEDYSSFVISSIPECVVVSYDNANSRESFDHEIENFVFGCDAIVIGPGLSRSLKARHMVQKVLELDTKVVLDADALNIISEHLEWFEERVAQTIITPHIGEMARLTGYSGAAISENTLQFAEAFSDKYKVCTVLKSARTIIVSKELKRFINLAGNSGLATAGSGDVLSGVIAGLLAQGYNQEESAVFGVLLHSVAGDMYVKDNDEHSLIASDIIENLWRNI